MIRDFQEKDWAELWPLLREVFREGETYAVDPGIEERRAFELWIQRPTETHVAELEGAVAGTYYIKPNQSGGGAHVCNCGYIVSPATRGRGLASEMCRHSQERARALGFRAMQYNLVVATNEGAIRLWERHGFEKVGRLPQAFSSPTHGLVDAFVMYKLI